MIILGIPVKNRSKILEQDINNAIDNLTPIGKIILRILYL